MTKVFVLGVDGGTLDVILPLVERGKLPNFARLIREGAWGELQSTVPPSSGPAWASFQTGKEPSSHGIFDFLNKKPRSYDTYYINSTHIAGRRLWDLLGDCGLKVGIINVMVTYPPRPVNGFVLTGGLTPTGVNFAYPEALAEEIRGRFGEYRLWGVGGINLTEGGERRFIDAYSDNAKRRMEIAKYLMSTREWDFFMVMFEETDPLQHELWKYMDREHPRYLDDAPAFVKDAIPNIYGLVDGFLGEVMGSLPDDATVFVMSDHGFGPMDRYILVNNFLVDAGLLKLRGGAGGALKRAAFSRGLTLERAYNIGRRLGLRRAAKAFRGGLGEAMLSSIAPSMKDIDWRRTRAFSVGTGGHIYLNVKGREPEGVVDPGNEYRQVRESVVRELSALVDPKTSNKAIERAFVREELHSGRFAEHAPDVSFLPARGFGTLQKQQFVAPGVFIDSPSCGTHRMDGVVMAWGPDIDVGRNITPARIWDLAPTILHLSRLSIPADMDGRVLTEVFREGSEPARMTPKSSERTEAEHVRARVGRLRARGRL